MLLTNYTYGICYIYATYAEYFTYGMAILCYLLYLYYIWIAIYYTIHNMG